MDSFKPAEISRMELGGNNSWKEFWESKSGGQKWGKPGQGGDGNAMTLVGERYGGDEGEEYKERLGCKVDGREFAGMPVKERKKVESRGVDPSSTARTSSPLAGGGGAAAAGGQQLRSQKAQNEDFFARKGNENAGRPEGLAPSQGGKYGGFGSEPVASTSRDGGKSTGALPGVDDFQKDPVAALSKGFGWFTSTVGKGAKTVNDGWIQPTAQKVRSLPCPPPSSSPPISLSLRPNIPLKLYITKPPQIAEADLATTARLTAAQAAKTIQTGTKGAADRFNSFVEDNGSTGSTGGGGRARVEPERRDFWDSFGDAAGGGASAEKKRTMTTTGAIGTAAMRKGGAAGGAGSGSGGGGGGKDEGWGDW